jgi:hypothetical protein
MTRDEVEGILGSAQGDKEVPLDASGLRPGIPQLEAYYGPITNRDGWRPPSLGPLSLWVNCDGNGKCLAGPLFRRIALWPYRNIYTWSKDEAEKMRISPHESWWARFVRIQIGMSRSDTERIIGEGRHDHNAAGPVRQVRVYGDSRQRDPFSSFLPPPPYKISVEFSRNHKVVAKKYHLDLVGFETAPGWKDHKELCVRGTESKTTERWCIPGRPISGWPGRMVDRE